MNATMQIESRKIEKRYSPKPEQINELRRRFTYYSPNEDQVEAYTTIRGLAHDLALVLVNLCPDSRELSVALTKMDEMVMWANASIARRDHV